MMEIDRLRYITGDCGAWAPAQIEFLLLFIIEVFILGDQNTWNLFLVMVLYL